MKGGLTLPILALDLCSKGKKVRWSCYRPGVAQRAGRGIALHFHDRGTRTGWVVSSTPRPHFTPGKAPVPTVQEAGWASGPVWTGRKSSPHRDSIPDRPARSQYTCVVLYYTNYKGSGINNLLTYSMVQSPSWEANCFAASQEIPRISRNPKVHYRTHKPPPPVPILGQPNPVHKPTSNLLEIHPNIIHPSTPRSPQWSFSFRFPHQNPVRPPFLTHMRHMPSPSHSSRFYHPHNIGWGVQIITSSLCNLLHSPVTSSLLGIYNA